MDNTVTLTAQTRETRGKGPARQMRRDGEIPAVIYGKGREPQALTIARGAFDKILSDLRGEIKSTVFGLEVDGKATNALVREVQRHPSKLTVLHVDFYEIHAGEKITLDVPVILVGTPEGVRNGGGTLDQTIREVQVEVLPRHIPDHIDLDVNELGLGKSLHVSDIKVENMEILHDMDATVCSVIPPRVEAEPGEEEEGEVEGEEPELIRKPKEDEGEASED